MVIRLSDWQEVKEFLFFDLKLDPSSEEGIYSRYRLICNFLDENNLQFTRDSFKKYLAYKQNLKASNSYLNNNIKVAKYIHKFLHYKFNYDSGLKDFTYFKKVKPLYDILKQEEYTAIINLEYPYKKLSKQKNLRYHTLYLLLITTGVRISEALSLKWIDITDESIRILDTKTDTPRFVPNNNLLKKSLAALKHENKLDYVFVSHTGNKLERTVVGDDLTRRVKYLGIKKKVWIHLLRHTFCVEMLRRNSAPLVSKLMGHEDLSSIQSYSHYLFEDMQRAILTHPLLKNDQTLDNISDIVKDVITGVLDKRKYSLTVFESSDKVVFQVKKVHAK